MLFLKMKNKNDIKYDYLLKRPTYLSNILTTLKTKTVLLPHSMRRYKPPTFTKQCRFVKTVKRSYTASHSFVSSEIFYKSK